MIINGSAVGDEVSHNVNGRVWHGFIPTSNYLHEMMEGAGLKCLDEIHYDIHDGSRITHVFGHV